MLKKIIPRLMAQYGIAVEDVSSVQKGYRNGCYRVAWGSREANLIIYKNEAHIDKTIQRVHQLSLLAHKNNLPVRFPIDDRVLTIVINKQQRRYAGLYNYLPGHTIPWESYSKKHIKLLGQALSDLHYYWRNHNSNLQDVAKLLMGQYLAMDRYFNETGVKKAMRKKLKLKLDKSNFLKLQSMLEISTELTPIQPLHMDFVRGNVLFKEHDLPVKNTYSLGKIELTGILDFEKVAKGHIVFDLARSFAFLLVDCAHYNEPKLRKYFFSSGYRKRGRQSFAYPVLRKDKQRLLIFDELITYYLLYDFFKFLRHNPYEFLEKNYHYIRTRDLLVTRGMIQLT